MRNPLACRLLSALPILSAGWLLSGTSTLSAAVWYVPGVANAGGRNNTHFSSDVRILNRGTSTTMASFELIPTGGPAPAPVSRPIAPGETFVSLNVLDALWGYPGIGTLKVTVDQTVTITARTFNDADPSGTYGTALTPVLSENLLEAGDTAHAPWVSDSADASKGYRTNLAVFLALPDSSVDIVVYDPTGKEKGRTNVSGGPMMFQTSVSALSPGGLDVGRAEFRVLAGKAAAYVPVVDNVTGDGISIPAVLPSLTETSVVLNGVAKASGREGTFFRTDVRLFNLSEVAATVTVTPLSVSTVSAPGTVTLAPGEVKEIQDVLATVLKAPEGSTGSLLFTSGEPVMVLGRTSNVKRDGTPGTFGALETGRSTGGFLSPGSKAVLIGLRQTSAKPGYRSNIGFLAGADGATFTLSLRSRTGDLLGTNDSVSLGANGWTQPSLDSLFPGVEITDDSVLEVSPRTGRADVYASVIDNATGDPVINPAEDLRPYSCTPPEILTFQASPDTLDAAGPVTLTWDVSGADSLSGFPGASLDAESATVSVSASGAITLEAQNSCGTARKSVDVVIGLPTVQIVSGGSGQPGEVVTVRMGNVAVPANTGSILLTFPDGNSYRAVAWGTENSNEVSFTVPFVQDGLSPDGYRVGACTLTMDAFGPASNAVPFTILPLSYSGDPVAGFKAFLDAKFGAINSALNQAGLVEDFQPGFSEVTKAVTAREAILRKIASDLTGAESTTAPVDLPSDAYPEPEIVTVTRGDLGLFLALLKNLEASYQKAPVKILGQTNSAGACMWEKWPPLGACLALKAVDPSDWILNGMVGLINALGIKDDGTIASFLATGLSALISGYTGALETAKGACPALPVWLKNFIADPDRVKVDETQEVKVEAYLEFLVTSDTLASFLSDQFTKRVLKKLSSDLKPQIKDKWIKAATLILKKQTASIQQTIANWVKAHGGIKSPSHKDQIGECDLNLGFTRLYPRKYADFDGNYPQAQDSFYFKGIRRGTEVFYVVPQPRHFLLPIEIEEAFANPAPAFSVPNYSLPLRVGGTSAFSVNNIFLQMIGTDGSSDVERYAAPRTAVTRRQKFKFTARKDNFKGNTIEASTSDDLTFTVKVNGLAPPNDKRYTDYSYSFLFKTEKRGNMTVTGRQREAYLTVKKTIDGKNTSTLIDNEWNWSKAKSDNFTIKESYEVFNAQRLIHGGNGVGNSQLTYTFRTVNSKEDSGGGQNRKWSGGGPNGGQTIALSADTSSPNSLLAATGGGGIFKSDDAGGTWTPSSIGLNDLSVLNLSRDSQNPAIVYAGTQTGGVYQSKDGGATWASLGLSGASTYAVAPDPSDSSVLYAAQSKISGGLQKSLDGGATWSARTSGLPASTVPNSIAFGPESATLYLSTSKGFFKSTDSASTWNVTAAALTCGQQVVGIASQPFTVLARDCNGAIWRSRDDGTTWQQAGSCSGVSGFLSVIPGNALLMAAGSSVCKSTDFGSTWTEFPTGTTGGLNAAGYTPAGSGSIFGLSSTGILRSTNGGASFTPANDGLSATSIAQVLIDKDSAKTLYAAIYTGGNPSDQRLLRSTDGGITWSRIDGSLPILTEVKRLAQDPVSGALLAAGYSDTPSGDRSPKVARSLDGGNTWVDVTPRLVDSSGETRFISVFPGGSPTRPLYLASNQQLYVSTSGGSSWTAVGPLPNTFVDFPLTGNPKDANDLLCPVSGSGVYRSKDGGKTWTLLSSLSAMRQAFEVAFDPNEPTIQYAATSSGVYKSADDGKAWAVTSQTGLMRAVLPDPATPGSVYAGRGYSIGGGGGVFKSTDQGTAWTQIGTGFTVEKLAISADGLTICAATSGSGVKCLVPASLRPLVPDSAE
ncbi:MAG: hypothetical protein L6R30_04065 [Thermoanaerobaculia bacterium]|nr:hypothetical protein [Thermoanaerobaculia bacterium]